ncbi:MAG TPA: hypothetical protein VH089_00730 [Streptosporangiaceae bacterium]|nr:hypothetical protein [Streptosporangiaceae bacterium]
MRSQHDGIDWDRFAAPAPLSQPTAPGPLAAPNDPAAPRRYARGPAGRGKYDGIDWDCARDQGERVP